MWRKYNREEILCVIRCGRAFVEGEDVERRACRWKDRKCTDLTQEP